MSVATYDPLSNIKDDGISGNKIHGGVISAFSSQGIEDLATQTTLRISNERVIVDKIRTKELEGEITVQGSLSTTGSIRVAEDLIVNGKLIVNGVETAAALTAPTAPVASLQSTFEGANIGEFDNKGLVWNTDDMTYQFVFKAEPQRLYSSETIDVHKSAKYQIGGIDVLLRDRLGAGILHSNLRSVGTLQSLNVTGPSTLSETVFIGSLNRVGINTDQPNGTLGVVTDDVEIIIGSNGVGRGYVGTYRNQALELGVDNSARITIQTDGQVVFGNSKHKNAVVKVHGTLEVDNLVSDTRVERSTSLEFLPSPDIGVYNKGLIFKPEKGGGVAKRFLLVANPDRFESSEHIALAEGRSLFIGNDLAISGTQLGEKITGSNLTSVGILETLTVRDSVDLANVVKVQDRAVTLNSKVTVQDGNVSFTLGNKNDVVDIDTQNSNFSLTVAGDQEFTVAGSGSIVIGNKDNPNRKVNLYGKLAVNVTNPESEASFSVNGLMVIDGKKHVRGAEIPTSGVWSKGDIVWNSEPQVTSYIGWVCVREGTPGEWKPFGYIGEK